MSSSAWLPRGLMSDITQFQPPGEQRNNTIQVSDYVFFPLIWVSRFFVSTEQKDGSVFCSNENLVVLKCYFCVTVSCLMLNWISCHFWVQIICFYKPQRVFMYAAPRWGFKPHCNGLLISGMFTVKGHVSVFLADIDLRVLGWFSVLTLTKGHTCDREQPGPSVWSASVGLTPASALFINSQLSSWRVHVCLSMGYLVRSMLHATVVVILGKNKRGVITGEQQKTALLFWGDACWTVLSSGTIHWISNKLRSHISPEF